MTGSTENISGGRRAPFWELAAAACVVAGGVASWLYLGLADAPQKFPELISGSLAATGTSKPADLAVLFGFAGTALAVLPLLLRIDARLARLSGEEASGAFLRSLVYACLPAAFVLAAMLAVQRFDPKLLGLSGMAVAAVGTLAGLVAWRATRPVLAVDTPSVIAAVPFIAFCAGLAAPLGLLALSRLAPTLRPGPEFLAGAASLFVAAALVAGAGLAWAARPGLGLLLRRAMVLAQLPLALGYLACIPTPWVAGGKPVAGPPYGPALWLLVLALVALACWDSLRRWPRASRAGQGISGLVSPLALAGLLVLLRFPVLGAAGVPSDDYHFGESLLSWWGWVSHGLVPFRDLDPVRGLVSLLPQALSQALFDGTAVAQGGALAVEYALTATLWLAVLARFAPLAPAFCLLLLLLPLPLDYFASQTANAVLILSVCAAAAAGRQRRAVLTLLACAPALVLFATGDAGLVLLALGPVAVWCLQSCFTEPGVRRFAAQAGCILAAWGLVLLLTPAGAMLLGSLRYAVENAAVNAQANGVAWAELARHPGASTWLLELSRNNYLLVLIGLAAVCWPAWRQRRDPAARRTLTLAVTSVLFILLYILRVAIRIDPGTPSRLGYLCLWAMLLGLPALAWGAGLRGRNVLALVLVFMAGTVGSYWLHPQSLVEALAKSPLARNEVGRRVVDGAALGLPNLGRGLFEPAHLERLTALKAILDSLLAPDETYLDLTNRNAHYFYFDRPPPIASGAVYNLPAENQQRRALDRLAENPPPAVLIDADNVLHDGGPASLRCHLLYRRFVPAYVPVRLGRFGFLLRPDRYRELAEGRRPLPAGVALRPAARDRETELAILDAAFAQAALQAIPQSWGASWPSLAGGLSKVADLPVGKAGLHALRRLPDGRFEITGPDPYLVIPAAGPGLSGAGAGLLVLDFASDALAGKPVTLQLFYTIDGQTSEEKKSLTLTTTGGRLVVPLDAYPRWLLAGRIDAVRIDVADPAPCRAFSLANVALYQRNSAEAAQ
jgi:hypothetical protein